jgi:hypothetical protein
MGLFDSTFTPASSIGYTPTSFTPTTGSSGSGSSGSGSSGFFQSSAGQSALTQGIGALFNFGLSAFSSNQAKQNLKGQANIVAQQGQSALAVEQERTRQAQLALEASRNQGTGAGGNTALYIGLGVVGVVVLGVVIFAVTRKRSA